MSFATEYDAAAGILATNTQICCVCFDAYDDKAKIAAMADIPGYSSQHMIFEPVIRQGVLFVPAGQLFLACDIRAENPRFVKLSDLGPGARFVGSLGVSEEHRLLAVVVRNDQIWIGRVEIAMSRPAGQNPSGTVSLRGAWRDPELLAEPFRLSNRENPSRAFFDGNFVIVPLRSSLLLGQLENGNVRWGIHEPKVYGRTVRSVLPDSGRMLRRASKEEPAKLLIRAETEEHDESTLCMEVVDLDHVTSLGLPYGDILTTSGGMYGVDAPHAALVELTQDGIPTGEKIGFQRGSAHSVVRPGPRTGESCLLCLTDGNAVRLRLYTSGRPSGQYDLGTGQPLTPPLPVWDRVFCCWAEPESPACRGAERLRGAWIPLV